MLKRKKLAAGAAGLSLTLLAACGTGSSDGDSAKPTTSGEDVTLNLWAYEGYEDFLPVLIEGFEKKYPNITVEVTNIPEEQYTTKVETALAAGQPPDLGFIYSQIWLKQDQFLPLESVIEAEDIDTSTWAGGIVGTGGANEEPVCAMDGELYCLGSYTGTDMIIYNRDMLKEAGEEEPAPWPAMSLDEYADLACRLSDELPGDVYGTAHGDPITWLPWTIVVSEDGKTAEGVTNSPETVELYEQVAKMTQDGCAPSLDVLDPWAQGIDYFAQKKLAMVITDVQSLAKIEEAGIDYGITAPPAPPGGESFFNQWTDGIGVFRDSEHPDEAMLFIAYQATEGQKLRVEVTGDLPVSIDAAEEHDWAGDMQGRKDLLAILPNATTNIPVPNRWDAAGPLFDAFGAIVAGDDAQSVLDAAAKNFQSNLDKAWEEWENA